MVNPNNQPLNQNAFFVVLRLISMVQAGLAPNLTTALSQRNFPMVKINGVIVRSYLFYQWNITREIEVMYKGIFERLTKSFYLQANEARQFFGQSNIQANDLAAIWNLSDVDRDSMLSFAEFCLAMYFVHGVLAGEALPTSLPQQFLEFVQHHQDSWVVHPNEKNQYSNLFNQRSQGSLMPGNVAREILIGFNVPVEMLAKIWELCDRGKRGALDVVEFSAALHILKRAKEGTHIPIQLPSQLILSLQN